MLHTGRLWPYLQSFTQVGSGLTCKHLTGLERLSKDKPSSLLGLIINDKGKKFYYIDIWCQSYKTVSFVTLATPR